MPATEPPMFVDERRFEALRLWRKETAQAHGVPPYVVFHDATLRELAARAPASLAALEEIPGIGARKLERYGEAVLAVLRGVGEAAELKERVPAARLLLRSSHPSYRRTGGIWTRGPTRPILLALRRGSLRARVLAEHSSRRPDRREGTWAGSDAHEAPDPLPLVPPAPQVPRSRSGRREGERIRGFWEGSRARQGVAFEGKSLDPHGAHDMPFWLWLILGLVLLVGEMLTPGGFFIIFFGIGALVVGVLGLAGVVMPLWLQGVAFSAVSVVALLLFRKPLLERFAPPPTHKVDPLVGEEAVALEEIGAGKLGKVELRGTPWNARTLDGRTLAKGARVRVERVEGLTVFVGRAQ